MELWAAPRAHEGRCVLYVGASRARRLLVLAVSPHHLDALRAVLGRSTVMVEYLVERAVDADLPGGNLGGVSLQIGTEDTHQPILTRAHRARSVGLLVRSDVDLGVTAVRDRHDLLNAQGLGARPRGLLCGPLGTGKARSVMAGAGNPALAVIISVEIFLNDDGLVWFLVKSLLRKVNAWKSQLSRRSRRTS